MVFRYKKDAVKKAAPVEEKPAPKVNRYVCIRKCFDFGRCWVPQREALREKDYLLEVGADVKVSEKNFMRVDEAPELVIHESLLAAEEGTAFSKVKPDEFLN